MSGRRRKNDVSGKDTKLCAFSVPLHPTPGNLGSSVRSPPLVEGTPRAKTPVHTAAELKSLAESGQLLTIDKTFDLFGTGSVYFRRVILVYSLIFLLVDCSWQLVVDMDRKILEANERSLSELCSSFCKCSTLHEKSIPPILTAVGDSTQWGVYYLTGNAVACIFFIFTESMGRKRPLLISILLTAGEVFVAFWTVEHEIPMTIFILLFGASSVVTYVCIFVNALESLPYKLRLPFALFFFAARRVSRGLISVLALYTHGYNYSMALCTVFLLLAALLTRKFVDETAAHLLLQEKMYELEQLLNKIRNLVPNRTSQQMTDELGFRGEDVEMTTSDYLRRVFKSKAVFYIANVVLLVSVVVACTPLVSKRFHLMGIDSTFTSFAISLAAVPLVIPLVLLSSHNRFQWLTSIELGAGISILGLWCFTEGEATVCSDSTVYTGKLWWIELVALSVCEAFSMSVYIVGTVAMVEVVPTRARTLTVAILYTFSAGCAGITNRITRQNKMFRSTLEMPMVSSLFLLFALVSTLSYTAPSRMVDYLVDIISKEKSVKRVKAAPKRKKTQMEIDFPELSSSVSQMANVVEENSSHKTKDDNVEEATKTGI